MLRTIVSRIWCRMTGPKTNVYRYDSLNSKIMTIMKFICDTLGSVSYGSLISGHLLEEYMSYMIYNACTYVEP